MDNRSDGDAVDAEGIQHEAQRARLVDQRIDIDAIQIL
jgi:hypothetical protein